MAYSDEEIIKKIEAEARIKKPKVLSSKRSAFLNKINLSNSGCGGECQGVILTGYEIGSTADGTNSGFFYYNHNTNTYTQLLGATGSRHDIARWDNKLYAKKYTSGAGANIIQEYAIDPANCSVTHLRDIQLLDYTGFNTNNFGGWIDVGNAMDMKDANTIICGTVGAFTGNGAPWTGKSLIEVDISGSMGVASNIGFPVSGTWIYPNTCDYKAIDVIYMQDTDQYLVSLARVSGAWCGPYRLLRLFSSSGQLLEEVDMTSLVTGPQPKGLGMYRTESNGDIFITGGPNNTNIHAVTFGPLTISPTIQDVGFPLDKVNGAAYNSNASGCNTIDCYNIGDIGPEGGIIFSVPLGHFQNNGVNQTSFYYEVAQNDIAVGGTPDTGFNLTCGETFWDNIGYYANAKAIIGSYGISFDTTDPANAQFVNDINSGVISTQTLVNTTLTPTNQSMFSTPPPQPGYQGPAQPGPYITNITTGPGNVILLEFNTPIINSYYPLLTQVTFFNNVVSPGWAASGAEWGVHDKSNIVTFTDFGTGHTNTDAIDAYPLSPGNPTSGIHPWLNTHDIAATICKQQPSAKDDWFLPSYEEFREMMNQSLVVPQLGLNTSTQNSENYYWTSSHRFVYPSGTTLFNADKYAWAYNTNTDNLELAYRCHALSVRPIRRFECTPKPCPNPDCNFEYNYRDGYAPLDGGFMQGGGLLYDPLNPTASLADPNQIHWNTTNEGCSLGTPPVNLTGDSIIGSELTTIYLNRRDVLGNVHSDADFSNHTGYTISAWDTKYNFIGKWKYSTLHQLLSNASGSSPKYAYDRPGDDNYVVLTLTNVQHLEGNHPVVYYAGKPDVPNSTGSFTGIFLKIEWDGNTGNYETGCNSTIFGNPHPYYSPGNGKDWPYYCGPLYLNGVYTNNHVAIPRFATVPPLDTLGNTLNVYPDIYSANPNFTGSFPSYYNFSSALPCEVCDYSIGDTGPAGGIIVATPNMPQGSVTSNGIFDGNPTNFYYELSPVDIHDFSQGPSPEWGNWISGGIPLDYTGYPTYHNFINGYQNGGVMHPSADPFPIGTGNGEDNTAELMTTNPGANLFFPTGLPTAVELCDNYTLNNYNDWFLPSLSEWNFVRNNIPSISTGPTWDNLYWTSNYLSSDDWQIPNNPNIGHIPPATPATQGSHEHALMVDVNTTSTSPLLPGSYFAIEAARWKPGKVRAMRRFECNPPATILGCTDPLALNYDPNANTDDGSCAFPIDTAPCFSICAVEMWGLNTSGNPAYQGWDSWDNPLVPHLGPLWVGPIAMENNPIAFTTPPFSSNYPLPPQDFTAFYNWVVTQIPTLTVGDTFIINGWPAIQGGVLGGIDYSWQVNNVNTSYSSYISGICLKYEGTQSYTDTNSLFTPLYLNNYQEIVPNAALSNCCDSISSPIAGGSIARIGNFDGPIDSVNLYNK